MSKALWIEAFEGRVDELADEGLSWNAAYEQASTEYDLIQVRAADRMADMIDAVRDRAKYEGL